MNKYIVFASIVLGLAAEPLFSQTSDDNPRLTKALERFPAADTDKDGVLTMAEARAFKKKRAGQGNPGNTRPEEDAIDPEALKPLLQLYEAREFEGVKYRLLKPIDLGEYPGKKYPMILSLHGAGGSGNDNVRNLRSWNEPMAQEDLRRKHPCFVVVPQSVGPWRTPDMAVDFTDEKIAKMPKEWQEVAAPRISHLQNPKGANLHRVFKLLDAMAEEFPIDTDRVYVLGHSMGGFGTWTAVTRDPDRFAAAIASAGWIGPWVDVARIKDLPMWAFQGAKDKEIQTRMGNSTFERMQQLGHNLKFTEMANRGHNVSGAAFEYTGDSPVEGGVTKYASDKCDKTADVWDWLFKQKRAAPSERNAETPDATKASEKPTASEVPVSRKGKIKGKDGEKRGARLEPTHTDVSYGDHIRH
jgi:poly(3-hydroxybutyrate) depolymerase